MAGSSIRARAACKRSSTRSGEDDLRATGLDFHRPFVEDVYADADREMDLLVAKCRASGLWTPGPLALPA